MSARRMAPAQRVVGSRQAARRAVARRFYRVPGRMDIRYLWTRDGVHYFRVNFWRRRGPDDVYIWRSCFVRAEPVRDGYVVRPVHLTQAA